MFMVGGQDDGTYMVSGKHRGWTEWFIEHTLYGQWREWLPEKATERRLITSTENGTEGECWGAGRLN